MSVFHFGKSATVPMFVRFPSAFLFTCATGYPTFRTTTVNDTKLTLRVIPFQVGWNNSLIFLALQTYDKKVYEFPFLVRYTIPWSLQNPIRSYPNPKRSQLTVPHTILH